MTIRKNILSNHDNKFYWQELKRNIEIIDLNFLEFHTTIIKESIEISSIKDSRLVNNKLRYKGKIDFNPFHFVMNVDIEKLNFIKNIFLNDLIRSLFEMDQLYNENLSVIINLRIQNFMTLLARFL